MTARLVDNGARGISTKLDLSPEELIRQADAHTRCVQAWLSSRSPDAARFQGAGVTATSTGLGVRLLNLALGGDYPPGTADVQIDAEIERVSAFFDRRGAPWYWWVGPNCCPADLPERLRNHGLVESSPLPSMVGALPADGPAPQEDVQVWQARDIRDLQAASLIRHTAFRFPEGEALTYFEDMAEDWLRGDPARLYLARRESGPTAAIGALIMGEGRPGVYIMATLPQWGRRGLGSAILRRILAQASTEGYSWAALTAGEQGYPLYRKFGFEHIFDYHLVWSETRGAQEQCSCCPSTD